MKGYKTWVEISEQALRSNIVALQSLLEDETVFAGVVKANAYGHGIEQVIPIMLDAGIQAYCVDSIDEAILVRALAPDARIIILGYTLHIRLDDVITHRLDQTIYDPETLKKLDSIAKRKNARAAVHLKIETGTMRQGLWPESLPFFVKTVLACSHVDIVGISTHFANIEDSEDAEFAEYQMKKFIEAQTTLRQSGIDPKLVHTACSAAVVLYPRTHGTLVRPGISTYGFWPSREVRNTARLLGRRIELNPVLSWKSRVAQIKDAPMGTTIGYGCTETLRRYSKIAIIPVGYYDGYDRRLSSTGEVIIRGQLCRILGRVCMNMFMVDVTEVPLVELEDEVVLIGRGGKNRMRADDLAHKLDTIHYEITSRINSSIPRFVL